LFSLDFQGVCHNGHPTEDLEQEIVTAEVIAHQNLHFISSSVLQN
jgi:hypothetical protein